MFTETPGVLVEPRRYCINIPRVPLGWLALPALIEGAPYGKSTRCPPGGTPVLESTSTVPPRSSVELFYIQPVQGRLPKIPIGRIQPLEIVWNGAIDSERPPKCRSIPTSQAG